MNETITLLPYGILIAISIIVGILFWQRRQTGGALRPIAGEQLIEQLNEIVIVVDTNERILVINEAARRLINKPAHEIIGRTTIEIFPANADLVKRFAGVTEFQSEIESPGTNGTVYYDLNMKPLYDRSGRLIGRLAVAHDITAFKQTQGELSKQQTRLKQVVSRRTAALTRSNNQLKQEVAKQEQLALKLRDQDERLRLMAEATFEGLAITEGEVFAEANEQMAAMLGTTVKDLIGKSIFDYVAPELQKEAMLRIVAGEQVLHDQIAVRHDGTRLPVEVRTRLISRDGREMRLLAVRDMTESHKAQRALRESEERFRLILENTPILLDAFDSDGNIIAWNRACEEVTGYSPQEMIGNPRALELLYPDPDYRARLWEESKDPTIHESTFDLVTKSGEVRSVTWFESYQKLAIPGWPMWGMGIDVTERERAVAALRDSEKRYRAIVEDQMEFVVRWKPDGTRTYANPAYCRYYGLDYDQVVGTSFFPLIAKEAQRAVRKRLDALKLGDPVSTDVHEVINPDGSRGWQEWTDRALFDEDGKLLEMQSVGRDVTQRVLAEEAEREQRTLNEALVESASALNSLLDLDKVLDMVLMSMRRTVQHDTSNVMLIEGGMAKVVRANGYSKNRDPLGSEYPLNTFSLMRQLIETQRPLYVPDTRNDPTFVRTKSSKDILSFVSIPIIMKGSVIGIINLDSRSANAFNEKHVNRLMGFADQAAIAIHNARLYEAEREQRALNEALVEIAATLNSVLDLDKVLESVFSNLSRAVKHDAANVMLIEDGFGRIIGANGYPNNTLPIGTEYPLAKYKRINRLFNTGEAMIITDTQHDTLWVPSPQSKWVRSVIGVPIQLEGQVIGAIFVDNKVPNFFTEKDLARLSAFANQVATAIHNARLYEAEREQRALNEALVESAAAVNRLLELDSVLDTVLSNVRRAVKHDASNIMLVENGVARIVRTDGYAKKFDPIGAEFPLDNFTLLNELIETQQPQLIKDTTTHLDFRRSPTSETIRSVIGAPIIVKGEVIGVINLDSLTPDFFDEQDITRLLGFADQAAIAIHNARLYEAEHKQRKLAEMLQQTASTLLRTLNTHDTLTVIMDQLAQVVGYDQAMLLSVEETALRIKADRGLPRADDRVGQMVDYASSSVVKKLLASGSPLILLDVQQEADAQDYPGVMAETRAWMAIPLLTWDIVTGLLIVGSNRVGAFNMETANAANAFAQQAAIAIQNVRSMTELSETVHRLREAQTRLTGAARLAAAGEIAAGVAHQLNNPLTAVIAEVSLLLKHLPTDHPYYESAVNIRTAAEKAAHIVQRQLNLSKAIPYEMEETDINRSIAESISLVRSQIEPSAHLLAELSPDLPPIMASPEHLSDVWLNLLLNARDGVAHTPNAEIRVRTKVDHKQNGVIIAIEDNGEGIPHEHLEHIFDPFFTTRSGGHGLGLPVCYEVVRRHNGTIQLDSRVGEGTNITVVLPIATSELT